MINYKLSLLTKADELLDAADILKAQLQERYNKTGAIQAQDIARVVDLSRKANVLSEAVRRIEE